VHNIKQIKINEIIPGPSNLLSSDCWGEAKK